MTIKDLCVIDIYSKYAWALSLYDKKEITIITISKGITSHFKRI